MWIDTIKNPICSFRILAEQVDKVISCNWFDNPEKFGIANNIITKVYNDHNQLKVKKADQTISPLKIIYIQEFENEYELKNLLHIISIFNQLNTVILSIYTTKDYAEILQNYSNDHIRYINKLSDKEKDMFLEANVIITYGPGAIHFIKQNIPVVIVGPYGLGGWVTPENFWFLLKNGFVGRPGGSLEEFIPVDILAHELLSVKESKDLSSILLATKKIVDDLPYKPLSAAQTIIDKQTALRTQLNDPAARWQAVPVLASNILFDRYDGTVAIKRKYINDTLCTVSEEDISFFTAIDGKTTCHCLCKAANMDEHSFWETIDSLSQRKIIFF